jgi:release factor glutamine methyltransferase
MKQIKEHVILWQNTLSNFYDSREVKSLFRIACEDILNYKFSDFDLNAEFEFSDLESSTLNDILSRLSSGEPIQHIVGFTFFNDLKIHVTKDVLIPRPETEELIYWINENIDNKKELSFLDWCTGSGCIALALKKNFPKSNVKGYDISDSAIEIARKNALENNLEVDFQINNALDFNSEVLKYDVIVSNPPYIPEKDKAEMHPNVLNFDPELALFVPDSDYLKFYKSITNFAFIHLNNLGELYFEIHENYAYETIEVLEESGFSSIELKKDLQGKDRMIRAIKTN